MQQRSASTRVANADVNAAALHVPRKGRKLVLPRALRLAARHELDAAVLSPATAARDATTAACCTSIRCLRPASPCQHARHAVVAAPRGAGQHNNVAASQQQRRGRRVPGGPPYEEDGVAAQAEGHQGLVQAGLGVVYVPVQGVACTGQACREGARGSGCKHIRAWHAAA